MSDFDDILDANATYAASFDSGGLEATAAAGLALITCMDSRIDPLAMTGLGLGDAKVFRIPGARVDASAVEAMVLAVHLLGCRRIMVVPHTRCGVVAHDEPTIRAAIADATGLATEWQPIHVVDDQQEALARDVRTLRSHPLIPDAVPVGGFLYDVDTGRLDRLV